jgi:hypothetical protein
MAKGALITNKTKALIARVYQDHSDWPAKTIQHEVDKQLLGNGPRLSAVQKQLAVIRDNISKMPPSLKELDTPWNLGTLLKYPISPSGLPAVLNIRVVQDACERSKPADVRRPLTIRQALWADRLHSLLKDDARLLHYALEYANIERIYESLDQPCDTSDHDSTLIYSLRDKISKAVGMTPEQLGLVPITSMTVQKHKNNGTTETEHYEIRDGRMQIVKNDTEVPNERSHNKEIQE